ncbi:MAG: hypothetical protein LDL23_06360, partial [Flavobacterium sp.]|uniref:hypothetical protein n=1 Tax=Flavobacterium sp. TaxID=239 RepID=UPI0025C134D5
EEQYQFTIANKPVKVIETESATSYTILINREIDDVNSFENLIVQQLNSGETTANIIKYVPFQPATIESYFLNGDFNGNRTITPIVYNANLINTTNKITNICSTVCTTLCYDCDPRYPSEYQTPHTPGEKCPTNTTFTTCSDVCETYDDGGGGIDLTGGGGTGGTTGEVETPPNDSGNNNPIVTAPVLELEEEENILPKDPCKELKELLKPNDSIIRPIIGEPDTIKRPKLKPRIELIGGKVILPNEYGCTFSYQKFGDKYIQGPIEGGEALTVALNVNGFIYGGMHSHSFEKGHSIPSFGDMDWIADCHYLAKDYNKDKVFEIIAVRKSGSIAIPPEVTYYAFKVDDINILKQKIEQRINDIKPITLSRDEKIKEIHREDGKLFDKNPNDLEKKFLEKYENYGLSLYKANQNLTNWGKLTLNSNGTVENNPCGN